MANFFGQLVGLAPYALNAVRTREAEDEAAQQRALARIYQSDANQRANLASGLGAQKTLAEIRKLGLPPLQPVTYKPDAQGNYIGLPTKITPGEPPSSDDTDAPSGAPGVTPLQTGVKAPAKAAPKPPAAEPLVKTVGAGGKVVYTPRSQAAGAVAPTTEPQGDKTLVQVQGPDGQPIWMPRSQAAGMPAKQTTERTSATDQAAKARMTAAISEMGNADSNMAQFENELASGHRKINAGSQLLQRVANAFTHDDPLSQLTQSGALAALNQSDPDLARYIRRGLSFAEGESMISQRPSDFRTRMSAFLSTAASGASSDMIRDIQGRRHAILGPLNAVNASTPGSPSGKGRGGNATTNVPHPPSANDTPGNINLGASPTREQQLWDAAVAKHGKAKVLQEYGPRPGGDDE